MPGVDGGRSRLGVEGKRREGWIIVPILDPYHPGLSLLFSASYCCLHWCSRTNANTRPLCREQLKKIVNNVGMYDFSFRYTHQYNLPSVDEFNLYI